MLSLAQVCEFPTFSNYKISITLLIFSKCRGEVNTFPTAKLTKIFENECVTKEKIADYDTPDMTQHGEGESIEAAVSGTIPHRKASLDPTDDSTTKLQKFFSMKSRSEPQIYCDYEKKNLIKYN